MDELLELWEVISGLIDPEILDGIIDIAPDLSDLVETLEITDLDAAALDEMAELGTAWPEEVPLDVSALTETDLDAPVDVLEAVDGGELGQLIADLPADGLFEPVSILAEGTEPWEAASRAAWMATEVAKYPPEIVEGLDLSFLEEAHPEALGEYNPNDAAIAIFGSHDDQLKTLHHEIGHHAVMTNPELKQTLLDALTREGFDVRGLQPSFLESYSRDGLGTQIEELCAQAVSLFKTHAGSFTRHYPESADVLREWLAP